MAPWSRASYTPAASSGARRRPGLPPQVLLVRCGGQLGTLGREMDVGRWVQVFPDTTRGTADAGLPMLGGFGGVFLGRQSVLAVPWSV